MSKDLKFAIGMATHPRKISWSFIEWLIRGLLSKLKKFGIGGNLLKWFSDYLSDRSQSNYQWSMFRLVKSYCWGSSRLCIGSIAIFCIYQ